MNYRAKTILACFWTVHFDFGAILLFSRLLFFNPLTIYRITDFDHRGFDFRDFNFRCVYNKDVISIIYTVTDSTRSCTIITDFILRTSQLSDMFIKLKRLAMLRTIKTACVDITFMQKTKRYKISRQKYPHLGQIDQKNMPCLYFLLSVSSSGDICYLLKYTIRLLTSSTDIVVVI